MGESLGDYYQAEMTLICTLLGLEWSIIEAEFTDKDPTWFFDRTINTSYGVRNRRWRTIQIELRPMI